VNALIPYYESTIKNSREIASEIIYFYAMLYVQHNFRVALNLCFNLKSLTKCLATAECNGSLCNIEFMASNLERCWKSFVAIHLMWTMQLSPTMGVVLLLHPAIVQSRSVTVKVFYSIHVQVFCLVFVRHVFFPPYCRSGIWRLQTAYKHLSLLLL
jgi:hypothetical protein